MKSINWRHVVLGIGIGLLFAAALFLKMGGKEKEVLSDREVIDRARELGMIFLTESIDIAGKEERDMEKSKVSEEKTDKSQNPKEAKEDNKEDTDKKAANSDSDKEWQVITEEEKEIILPDFIEKKSYF